jgi:hypothetical protein
MVEPRKWPSRHKDTEQACLLEIIFVFGCFGGDNILPQNAKNYEHVCHAPR